MGVLSLGDFYEEVQYGGGNRADLTMPRVVRLLNLAQSRIARSYDFYEMGTVAFAQMSFTSNPAYDKYMIPPPLTKTIHSFVCLDTSSASSAVPPSEGGISGGPGGPISGGPGGPISGGPLGTSGNVVPFPPPSNVVPNPSGSPMSNNVIGSLGTSRKVIEKPWRWFDAKYPAPEWIPAGWPAIYKRFGNIITMVPAPYMQFTAQLSYTAYPTPFAVPGGAKSPVTDPTDLTQVSTLENKDDIIIAYALCYLFKSLGEEQRAAYFEGVAKTQLDEAMDRDDTRPDMEVSRDIPVMAGAPQGPYWADPWVKSNP